MPIVRVKVNVVNQNVVLPEFGEEGITGFSLTEEIKPNTKTAFVYVAGCQTCLDSITSLNGKTDVSAQCEALHLKEAKDKSEKVKEKEVKAEKAK